MEKVSSEVMLEDFELDDQALNEENLVFDSNHFTEIETYSLPEGIRLDVGMTDALGKSRSFVQGIIAQECVRVNGLPKKANYKVRLGDLIEVTIPTLRESTAEPENIPLEILYEDEDILVVNKPQGMVVHPAPGAWTGTMVNALLYHCHNLSGINGVLRPGIVHRIDKDTSGILVVAKNDIAHVGLAAQLKAHTMERKYLALVHGVVSEPSGTVDAPIGRDPSNRKRMAVVMQHSKPAVTHYTVLDRFSEVSFLEVRLETGRTHQIRVHMLYVKHPVLGDPVYGSKRNPYGLQGQMLHATHLGFEHPRSGTWMKFDAPLPKVFAALVKKLRTH
ncbi:RluA family pseudouridine synthase [Desulfosporosinus sp. BICA1-9]|uniref:RluA family pseudouridine synthase n=2 Tax=Desulfosporosinus sp. BICA1-9 TaxID=1531958 RepID=UPI00054C7298|nr:RluA family pseudouridine synthase [Desulfosporosinus sp. BICA1-9]KJS50883.1 MAG: pseudouridine synthase [Peptococcaceae bacterium BRH_c23]KJS79427.1 MAG: pseudouridine synthase [Desulfosporosinus sp. BICA1-9]HBW37436.1 RluA family pseudouridine synthase [Desulfosporosinus sp.]